MKNIFLEKQLSTITRFSSGLSQRYPAELESTEGALSNATDLVEFEVAKQDLLSGGKMHRVRFFLLIILYNGLGLVERVSYRTIFPNSGLTGQFCFSGIGLIGRFSPNWKI